MSFPHRAFALAKASFLLAWTCTAGQGDHRQYGEWRSGRIGGGGYLQQVVWAPTDPRRLYLTSDVGGCWRSDDSGRTWRMLHGAMPPDASSYSVRGVAVDPRDANRALFAFDSGVWLTEDAGRSFRRTLDAKWAGNGPNRYDGRVILFHPADSRMVLAASLGAGCHISFDRGLTWTRTGPDGVNPVELYVDAVRPDEVYLASIEWKGSWIGRDLIGGLFRSDDRGRTWKKLSDEPVTELVRMPGEPDVMIALEDRRQVLKSTDGGTTWTRFADGLAPREKGNYREDGIYKAICAGPDFLVLGGHGGYIYRLDRRANSWRKVFHRDARFVEEGDWWGSLKRTYPHFGSALGWIAVSPHNPNHWAFTDWYALYQSRDAGKTWELTIDGIEMTVAHVVVQDPTDTRKVHVGVADVGYFRSSDGGETFEQNTNGISNNIKHIAICTFHPSRFYAVGPQRWEWHANQVFRSDDGGLSWQRSPMHGLPNMEHRRCNTIAVHPRRPDEVYLVLDGDVAPGGGGVWKSTDGGISWSWFGEGLPREGRLFRTDIWVAGPEIAVSADGSIVAASDDRNRVFRRPPGAEVWQEISFKGVPGGVNAVAADPKTPGRFFLCRKEGGLWESTDGGATWTRISDRDTWSMAVDLNDPRRLASNGSQGIFFSRDSGRTWTELDKSLPYRHLRNVLAFAGDRLIVATGGNGVFWADLRRAPKSAQQMGSPMRR